MINFDHVVDIYPLAVKTEEINWEKRSKTFKTRFIYQFTKTLRILSQTKLLKVTIVLGKWE